MWAQNTDTLTNETVARMIYAGVPIQTVLLTIQNAPTAEFRLMPVDLTALSDAKVPEEVIKAMAIRMNGRPATSAPEATTLTAVSEPTQVPANPPTKIDGFKSVAGELGNVGVIPDGTKVRVRLEQTLSSATADEGQPVQLAVTEDVKIGDATVIAQGATVTGTVTQAIPKRRMGRTGKLDFSIDRVTGIDGDSVPVRYSIVKKEGGSHAVRTGVITAGVAAVFWPAAPFMLLAKGKDTTLNKGMVFEVFTDSRHVLKLAGGNSAASIIEITSSNAGAEIEVDGKFVGNTPSTIQISQGEHRIRVSNASKAWERIIQVSAGSKLSLTAILE